MEIRSYNTAIYIIMYYLRKSIFVLNLIVIILPFQMKEASASNSTSLLILPAHEENSMASSHKVLILKQIDYNLWKFVPPILYIAGTIGNMLTIAVLRR